MEKGGNRGHGQAESAPHYQLLPPTLNFLLHTFGIYLLSHNSIGILDYFRQYPVRYLWVGLIGFLEQGACTLVGSSPAISYDPSLCVTIPYSSISSHALLNIPINDGCRYHALYQTNLVKAANITHILSIINPSLLDTELLAPFKSFVIPVEDDPNENLLQYFEDSCSFLREGLESGKGVFVHW